MEGLAPVHEQGTPNLVLACSWCVTTVVARVIGLVLRSDVETR
jgi:hypothetical protein